MMSPFLRDALVELLFQHMAVHVERGLSYDEALTLGVQEIRHQIRGSRLDLEAMLIEHAMHQVHEARQDGTKLH
jgi:hypothetical protein